MGYPTQELRLRQQMTLAPRLQQSVKLLQMSALEFTTAVEHALATNPFLEEPEEEQEGAQPGEATAAAPEAAFPSDEGAPEMPAPAAEASEPVAAARFTLQPVSRAAAIAAAQSSAIFESFFFVSSCPFENSFVL